jgi:hypothetical protein
MVAIHWECSYITFNFKQSIASTCPHKNPRRRKQGKQKHTKDMSVSQLLRRGLARTRTRGVHHALPQFHDLRWAQSLKRFPRCWVLLLAVPDESRP